VAEFIASVCAAGGVPRKTCLRLTLLVEELFTNTVVHGHGRDTEAPIHLTFDVGVESIGLTYEDTAPPHDPFAKVGVPDEAAGVEERPVGGLGVMLIAAMAERVRYTHADGRNRISLIMPSGRIAP
jgi:serine/threonine-protein kinase RsbW